MSPQQPHEVPRATVASAVASLTKWMRARAAEAPPNLLTDERDDLVLLQLSLRRVPASPTTKPHLLPLPHPIYTHASASICVISDDRPNSRSPAASDLLDASKSLHLLVSEVIPLSTLRTDYRPYESRRRLAASHDLFLADRAVLPLLPRVLGKAFYSTKKAPIAVDFTRAGWPEQVRKVLSSTFLYLRSGTCSGIKVGRLDMEGEEIVENVMGAVEAAVEKVPKKWANVRALHLKAMDSVALPIYQVVPELGMKIEVPVGRLEGGGVSAGEVIDATEVETGGKRKYKKKKALRYSDANDGEEVAKEESGKRKRYKEEQVEDVVMEEVPGVTEKRKTRKGASTVEVPANEGQKVGKKGKGKSKRALDMEVEDASVEKKKGKKSELTLEEAGINKRKGKKEGNKQALGEVEDVGGKKNKCKKGEVKEGKKSVKGNDGDGEVPMEEESISDVIRAMFQNNKEEKKSKGKKLNSDKMKKSTRGRV